MRVKVYGTRGSTPVSNSESIIYGGNTTNLRIYSECLSPGTILSIDAGSGFLPMSMDVMKEGGVENVYVLFTHYHHDHTQGLFLSPFLFMKNLNVKLIGPIDTGVGPKKMIQTLFKPPFFPVHYKEIKSNLSYEGYEFVSTLIIVFHPKYGQKTISKSIYYNILKDNSQLKIGNASVLIDECLLIFMHKSNHPEHTVAYRIEERPTGKVFVFLTDHENEYGLSSSLREFLLGVDFLIMDSQYTIERYEKATVGFGHATPDYCARIAKEVGIKKMGLTHHDPNSKDKDIEDIVQTAIDYADDENIEIFGVKDYQEEEI
ncbi:MBL fold metallo-hydrolase [Candidatus Vampirococcus lugosii]|uniref:Beta-lactamase n=1 Tax=Candidatus Vampirococcus lugosii TaxID=2789015 RepID=A0ABS5QKB9_9BACT|nr:MBL fold metallo-hydrolase [Candidatus Vampirococcus lugosii]MBS8121479.1 beta-lactamase [Candidatus Vampirococcus lugosii]